MVAARETSHPAVVVDCPVCGRPLPPVVVDVDARADGRLLSLTVRAQDLDGPWWAAVAAGHPGCLPPGGV